MRKIVVLLLVIVPILSFAQKEWFPVDASAERIKISFYEQPYETTDTIDIGDGTYATVTVWEIGIEDASHPNGFYSMGVSTFPSTFIHSDSSFEVIESFLESVATPMIENEDFEFLSSKIAMKDGYPGKDYKFKVASGGMLEMKVYMVQNQLFQCSVITRPDSWFNTSIDKFQDSFKLIGRGQNKVDYGFTHIKTPTYKINFPGKPELQSMYTDSEYGKLNVRIEMFEGDMKNGDTFFMAGETKFPESFQLTEENKEAHYTRSINGALNNTNATLVDRKILKRDGYEIVEIYATMYEGSVNAVYRIFWIKNASYIQAVMSREKGMTKEAEAFFESFERLK